MIQVDFAIITIRPDEFTAVLQRFPAKVHKGTSGRTYGISQVQTKTGQNCVVAVVRSSEQGNDAAQQIANDMINDLNPQMLLVVGIAGGVPSDDFTLGDVVISTRIDNFNVSKRYEDGTEKFDIRGGIHPVTSDIAANLLLYQEQLASWNAPTSITLKRPTVDLSQFDTDTFKKKITVNADKDIASWYRGLQASIIRHFSSPRPPLFETGTIASSNSLIRDVGILVKWLQTARSVLAVEMETAGVYQATQRIQQQYPVMAIRGISDIIGLDRDDRWTKYACQTAAAFTYAFVTAGIIAPRENKTSQFTSGQGQLQTQNTKSANDMEPIEVFISCSEKDEKFKKQLETHLTLLRREGIIRPWHSQQIKVGQAPGRRDQDVADHINSAQIILLLMSPNFLASDQLYENELTRAIERQKSGDPVRVIPIAVRPIAPSDPDKTPDFQKIQGLPRNGKPVETWRIPDEAWALIAQEIRQVSRDLQNKT